MARLVPEIFFARMAQIEKLQGAFKKLVDFLLADIVGGEESVQVEVRKAASGDASGKKLAQAAGIDGTKLADLFEDDATQGILKNARIEQPANFAARSRLNQDRTQEAERISLE
jgi:hypothetical protein